MVRKIKPQIRQVNPSSEEEGKARAYVQDLRTFANCVSLYKAFVETYENDLYPILNGLGDKGKLLAKESLQQFQHLKEKYEELETPNASSETKKSFLEAIIGFADELEEKVFELCPLGELEILTEDGTYKKV